MQAPSHIYPQNHLKFQTPLLLVRSLKQVRIKTSLAYHQLHPWQGNGQNAGQTSKWMTSPPNTHGLWAKKVVLAVAYAKMQV